MMLDTYILKTTNMTYRLCGLTLQLGDEYSIKS